MKAAAGCSAHCSSTSLTRTPKLSRARATEFAQVCFAKGGRLVVAGSEDAMVRVWALHSGVEHTLSGHLDDVTSVATTAAGWPRVVSGSTDGSCRVWDLTTGKCENRCPCANTEVCSVAMRSSDGLVFAAGCADSVVRLFHTATGVALSECVGHADAVLSVVFSPVDNLLASASLDGTLRCWKTLDGADNGGAPCECVRSIDTGGALVLACCFSSDGQWLASGEQGGTVRLYDGNTLELAWQVLGFSGPAVSLSMVGPMLAVTNAADAAAVFDVHVDGAPQ
jgi:WD40 repeat protein